MLLLCILIIIIFFAWFSFINFVIHSSFPYILLLYDLHNLIILFLRTSSGADLGGLLRLLEACLSLKQNYLSHQ